MRAPRASPAILFALLAACGGAPDAAPHRSGGAPTVASLAAPTGAAVADLKSGRLAEARATLEASLAKDPDGMGALGDLAVSYAMEERFDAARQLFEEVLAQGSPRDQQSALVNIAELYAIDGYLTAAGAYLASAKAIDPSRPEPSYALALLADARGDGAGAATAMREALDADSSGSARRALAFVYPEEQLHLEALVAEVSGDTAGAEVRWRDLAHGRFSALVQAAQRRLEGP